MCETLAQNVEQRLNIVKIFSLHNISNPYVCSKQTLELTMRNYSLKCSIKDLLT